MHDDEFVQRIANALLLYGRQRPNSADSARGIRDWWLADFDPRPSLEQVVEALDLLVDEGTFICQTLDDGSQVWRPSNGRH